MSENKDTPGTRTEAALLAQVLADRDVPCPVCGYNLRGLTTNTCPECGETLKAWVKPGSLRLGWWVTSLIGLTLGAGFSASLAVILAFQYFRDNYTPDARSVLSLLAVNLLLVSLIAACLWARKFMLSRSRSTRIALAAAAWFFGIGSIVSLFLVLSR